MKQIVATIGNSKRGDRVYCILNGWGTIKNIKKNSQDPILVDFADCTESYYPDGRWLPRNANPCLYKSAIDIIPKSKETSEKKLVRKVSECVEGDKVFCIINGWGTIVNIYSDGDYPIVVEFENTKREVYSLGGFIHLNHSKPALYTEEPTNQSIKNPTLKDSLKDSLLELDRQGAMTELSKAIGTILEGFQNTAFNADGKDTNGNITKYHLMNDQINKLSALIRELNNS